MFFNHLLSHSQSTRCSTGNIFPILILPAPTKNLITCHIPACYDFGTDCAYYPLQKTNCSNPPSKKEFIMKAVMLMIITAGFTLSAMACSRGGVTVHPATCYHHDSWYEVCSHSGPVQHRIEYQWHTVSGRRVLRYRRVTYHSVSRKWSYNPWQVQVNVNHSSVNRSCCSNTRAVAPGGCNAPRPKTYGRSTVTRVYNYSPHPRQTASVCRAPQTSGSSRIQQVSGRVRVR